MRLLDGMEYDYIIYVYFDFKEIDDIRLLLLKKS